jgi:hypothetical protein
MGKSKKKFPWLGSLDMFHTLSMSCLESKVILSWAPSYLGSLGKHIEKENTIPYSSKRAKGLSMKT